MVSETPWILARPSSHDSCAPAARSPTHSRSFRRALKYRPPAPERDGSRKRCEPGERPSTTWRAELASRHQHPIDDTDCGAVRALIARIEGTGGPGVLPRRSRLRSRPGRHVRRGAFRRRPRLPTVRGRVPPRTVAPCLKTGVNAWNDGDAHARAREALNFSEFSLL